MNKFHTAVLLSLFAAVTVSPVAIAQEKKSDPVAAACKGKKAGDEVEVAGKKVKCPEAKK